jgi:hypothetical protein
MPHVIPKAKMARRALLAGCQQVNDFDFYMTVLVARLNNVWARRPLHVAQHRW